MSSHSSSLRCWLPILMWSLLTVSSHAGKYSSGGGRSYSSAGSFSSARPTTPSVSTSRSSYSSGAAPSSSSFSRPATALSSTDAAAAKAKQVQQSSQNYAAAHPAPASSTPPPLPRTSYTSRIQSAPTTTVIHHYPAFSPYYSRPVVFYHDSYSSPFWWWLLDQPRPIRANWYYHHQSDMDPARQAALVAADPDLTTAVQAVATTTSPDPDYTPPGIEPAAMTAATDDAQAPRPTVQMASLAAPAARSSSGWGWFLLLGGGASVVWLVFFKRWQPRSTLSKSHYH